MNGEQIIRKKRDGHELSREEIEFFIQGMVNGKIPDYQVSALTMAIYFRGMNQRETNDLALAMANSGEVVDLSGIDGIKVDKHSTGGVGDKTTPVVIALAAAAGVTVAKMSGRGLGFTGGTIDKFESIPGFRTDMGRKEFIDQVKEIGMAIVAQSGNLVPADKKMYAIRDVTATVDSIPLIASSVMSKKIASGNNAIVLDVKVGQGAFMKDLDQAVVLAQSMVQIGHNAGRNVVAVISSMKQPLGNAVGNALEIREACETLQGNGPADLEEVCLELASHMIHLGGVAADLPTARVKAEEVLDNGMGFEKLCRLIEAQGGKRSDLERICEVRRANLQIAIKSPVTGFVSDIEAEEVGRIAMMLGAGRESIDDRIDHSVGLILRKKIGDRVKANEPLAFILANDPYKLEMARKRLLQAVVLSDKKPPKESALIGIVDKSGFRPYKE